MTYHHRKPRLERFDQITPIVRELHSEGVADTEILKELVSLGPVDLDMLAVCLQREIAPEMAEAGHG
jgi:hypothetical protein